MDDREHISDLIDRSLLGTLSDAEKEKFERLLEEQSGIREEYEAAKEIFTALEEQHNHENWSRELDVIHNDMTGTNAKASKRVNTTKRRRFFSTLAIAASISVLTFISTLFVMKRNIYKINVRENSVTYQLKGNLDSLNMSFGHLKTSLDSIKHHVPQTYTGSFGSCFLVSQNGYFITNHHIIKNAKELHIVNKTDSTIVWKARPIYEDPILDLALIQIIDSAYFEHTPLIADENEQLGSDLYSLGFPKKDIVYGEGVLSSENGHNGDTLSIQTSIPANPGNSGSPIFNKKGQIVGIITARHPHNVASTYAVKPQFIKLFLNNTPDSLQISSNPYNSQKFKQLEQVNKIKQLRKFVFRLEVIK